MHDSPIFVGYPEMYLPSVRERYIYYDIPRAPHTPEDLPHTGATGATRPTDR